MDTTRTDEPPTVDALSPEEVVAVRDLMTLVLARRRGDDAAVQAVMDGIGDFRAAYRSAVGFALSLLDGFDMTMPGFSDLLVANIAVSAKEDAPWPI